MDEIVVTRSSRPQHLVICAKYDSPMRFVVFGAGAIGSGLGGHLHRTGHDVVVLGRPAHVDRIRQRGLQLVTADETYSVPLTAVASPKNVGFTDGDVVLRCVKSQ